MAIKRYVFSCGDSDKGPVGFCVDIVAETAEAALEMLKARLPEMAEVDGDEGLGEEEE